MKSNRAPQSEPPSGPGPSAAADAARQPHPRVRPSLGFGREAGPVLGWFILSAAALGWLFPPGGVWPLAFVCLVPWAVAVCRTQRAWLVHWLSFLVGWGFFLVCLRWLMPVTGLGYAALAFYLALYWPLAAWAIRTARRHGVGPTWSLPITWVACEFLRALVMTGFPWLFVSHGLYQQLPLIQISDLAGAYGVTFVATMVNGLLAEWALRRWPPRRPHFASQLPPAEQNSPQWAASPRGALWVNTIVTIAVVVAALAYGGYRLRQVDFAANDHARGPRIAVVQHDFPLASTPPYGEHPHAVLARYLALGAEAAAQQPDLVVFPETAWNAAQNLEFVEKRDAVPDVSPSWWEWGLISHQAVAAFARGDYAAVNTLIGRLEQDRRRQAGAHVTLPRLPERGPAVTTLVGAMAVEPYPGATYPKTKRFNSVLIYDADGTQRRLRYDKNHLVPFGEFVPFRQARWLGVDLHWLYRWLNSLSPFSNGGKEEYSLTPGEQLTVFDLETPTARYRFGTPICYEDTTPYLIRRFVWAGPERRVDFLVNVSNDGWFQHSIELPQHLAICVFRAVENRVGIARSVNTGVSGFIDPNGRIYSVVSDERGRIYGPGIIGIDLKNVWLDARSSFYGRTGDWFAGACLLASGVLWLSAVFERWVLALRNRLLRLFGKRGDW
jgi:apolipoprotein N-acyltransferase